MKNMQINLDMRGVASATLNTVMAGQFDVSLGGRIRGKEQNLWRFQ